MATGDLAASAGLEVFAPTQDRREGYDNDNVRGDELADHMLNGGHAWAKITGRPTASPTAITAAVEAVGDATPNATPGELAKYSAAVSGGLGSLAVATPSSPTGATPKSYVDALFASVATSSAADTVTSAAYSRVAGSSRFAMWMDGSLNIGRSTSSIRYKEHVLPCDLDPAEVLALQPVTYHRIGDTDTDQDGHPIREFGLIAEQVNEHVPDVVTWFGGEIDGVRYDLVAVALLSVVRAQDARIAALEARLPTPKED